jgi:hypothetical protein
VLALDEESGGSVFELSIPLLKAYIAKNGPHFRGECITSLLNGYIWEFAGMSMAVIWSWFSVVYTNHSRDPLAGKAGRFLRDLS